VSLPIDVWDPERGGAERYIERLARSLARRGHELTVLCVRSRRRGAKSGAGEAEGAGGGGPVVEELRVPLSPRWRRELAFARESVRAHRRSGRDVLLAVRHALEADVYQPHGGSFRAGREAAVRAAGGFARCARRLVAPFRPTLRALLWLDRQVFARSSGLLTVSVSRKVEEDFRRLYPEVAFRFRRIPNAVDLERFHDRDRDACRAELRARLGIQGPPGAAFVALFLAENFRLKGLAHALGALRAARRWRLVVAGGDRRRPWVRRARALGVEARVLFTGAVEDPRSLHAGADALLLPSYYDTCSLATLEALACGTPVVTTCQNGASDLVEAAGAGFVVEDPRREESLARGLEALEGAWDGYHARALAARAGLSWERHVEAVEAVLLEAARARDAARAGEAAAAAGGGLDGCISRHAAIE
jgi:UDP-glucose:(heptosyl)LPS alpha-1,3-glucosyltransferase